MPSTTLPRNWLPQPRRGSVDDLDFKILNLIKDSPRISSRQIGEALGVAEITVRRRRSRLESAGYIRYYALPNPRLLGYLDEVVWVKVEPSKLLSVANALADSPLTRDVDIMNGLFNLHVTGYFESSDEFLNFLTDCVASQDGVLETQSGNSLRTVKRYFSKLDPVVEKHQP